MGRTQTQRERDTPAGNNPLPPFHRHILISRFIMCGDIIKFKERLNKILDKSEDRHVPQDSDPVGWTGDEPDEP